MLSFIFIIWHKHLTHKLHWHFECECEQKYSKVQGYWMNVNLCLNNNHNEVWIQVCQIATYVATYVCMWLYLLMISLKIYQGWRRNNGILVFVLRHWTLLASTMSSFHGLNWTCKTSVVRWVHNTYVCIKWAMFINGLTITTLLQFLMWWSNSLHTQLISITNVIS